MAYLIGDTIRLTAVIKNLEDEEEAPAAIALTVYKEDHSTKLLADKEASLLADTTSEYYVDWTISGESYTVAFDNGDSSNPIEPGDNLLGDDATPGIGLCVAIEYLTAATGTITYVGCSHQFVNGEVITGGGNTVDVNGTPAAGTDYLPIAETLTALWEWTGPHLEKKNFEVKPAI